MMVSEAAWLSDVKARFHFGFVSAILNDKQRRLMRYRAWIAPEGKPLRGCIVADISESRRG